MAIGVTDLESDPITAAIRVSVPDRGLRQDLRAISIVWRRELIRFRSDRLRAITSLVQPVLFLDEPTVGLDPQTRSSIWEYINDLKQREDITIFLTTHYMDEAENCDRIAIIDHGKIVALDTPEKLKASVGKDRVQITTADDQATIKELKDSFGLDAAMHENLVTFNVESGEQFVPRLFAELTQPIRSVSVARPSLDDVFMSYTGRTIRDTEASVGERNRATVMAFRRR